MIQSTLKSQPPDPEAMSDAYFQAIVALSTQMGANNESIKNCQFNIDVLKTDQANQNKKLDVLVLNVADIKTFLEHGKMPKHKPRPWPKVKVTLSAGAMAALLAFGSKIPFLSRLFQ